MYDHLPDAVREGLKAARLKAQRQSARLSVRDGEESYRILRMWDDGFALDVAACDKLRGRVDIYDGPRHLYQCLIVSSQPDGDECRFEFKWLAAVSDRPAADFVAPDFVPAGLLAAEKARTAR